MNKQALGLLCVVSLVPNVCLAMRCEGGLVDVGASKAEVIAKCGAPVDKEDTGLLERGSRFIYTEQWTYDMGSGKFMQILNFADGIVSSIANGPRR